MNARETEGHLLHVKSKWTSFAEMSEKMIESLECQLMDAMATL
jgi:hypothetical protein